MDRLGAWGAGIHDLEQSEVIMFLGTNPLVSHQAYGLLTVDPVRRLKAAKARGLKVICVDPRFTETARQADLYLQPIPGQDAAILAGMLRIILQEGWEDSSFCARYVGADRMADLREAVQRFTPEMAEQRAGLQAGQIASLAALFARDHKVGPAYMSTGGSFAPFPNLTRHLLDVLNIVCGRLKRAGDHVTVDPLDRPGAIYAEVKPPKRHWEAFPPSRIRGASSFFGQRLTPTLAEEILKPGEGQVRCLINHGGNPASVIPDHSHIAKAIRSLDLSVTVDPWFTDSAQLSDYVIAPKLMYERADIPLTGIREIMNMHKCFGQITPAVISPPVGSDVINDWYFYCGIATRLGLQLNYAGVDLDMQSLPTSEDLIRIRLANARIPFDELAKHPSGKEYGYPADSTVEPERLGMHARFDVMPRDVSDELRDFYGAPSEPGRYTSSGRDFAFLLTSRRSRHVFNSGLNQLPEVRKRVPQTPAFMNPDDMAELGIGDGQTVEIESDYGTIRAVVKAEDGVRRSVISVTHAMTSPSGGSDHQSMNVNALIDARSHYESIAAMPRMSAIPVNVRAAANIAQTADL